MPVGVVVFYISELDPICRYGGHIMVMGTAAVGRVSGVMLHRMGQTNILGRYPFHLHMVGANGNNSYLQDSSIYRSFYRCVSVHGTNSSRISRNVAHDVIGYCYYLEVSGQPNALSTIKTEMRCLL
jgi:hypothetical protein